MAKGFSLIEVLMAVTIFAIGISGLSVSFHKLMQTSQRLDLNISQSNNVLSLVARAEESLSIPNLPAPENLKSNDNNSFTLSLPKNSAQQKNIQISTIIVFEKENND